MPLNSSNSNIEEEFEQIKLQLMALSTNLNQNLDGNVKMNAPNNEMESEFDDDSISLDSVEAAERKKRKEANAKLKEKMNS